ncbi:MAG: AMP-binding protein, partial [bacterium]|nr:AMP-binding protein [bacterium]
ETIFKKLIHRHESLRTSFHMIDDTPGQRICAPGREEFSIRQYKTDAEMKTRQSGIITPFDLTRSPLLRVAMVEPKSGEKILYLDMHHIISDGISQTLLIEEFKTLAEGGHFPTLRLQYKDYAQWQNSERRQHQIRAQEKFWLKRFHGELPLLELPLDNPRPPIRRSEGKIARFQLDETKTKGMKEIARENNATLFLIILASYTVLLSKITGQEDIIIGTPTAGRRHADLEKIIGMFVNTLALRNYPLAQKSFTQYLREVKKHTLEAFENQEYPFEDLVEKLSVRRDTSRTPIFDVMVNMLNITTPGSETTPDTARQETGRPQPEQHRENEISKFDMTLAAREHGDIIRFNMVYGRELFKTETINRIITYYKGIIQAVNHSPGIKIGDITLISEDEKRQILYEFNDTAAGIPETKTIHELFHKQAEKTPGAVSVVAPDEHTMRMLQITYGELNRRANQLAQKLRQNGAAAGSIVSIMTDPSVEMIIAILAILKTGGSYLPINPENPTVRIAYMLADSNSQILLITRDNSKRNRIDRAGHDRASHDRAGHDRASHDRPHHDRFDRLRFEGKIIELGDPDLYTGEITPSTTEVTPEDSIYVIYTSGTTGKPKGVPVKHGNLVNYVSWFTGQIGIATRDRSLLTSSYAFDLGYTSVYPALLKGSQLHLIQKEVYVSAEDLL